MDGQCDGLTVVGHQFITLTVNICVYNTVGLRHLSRGSVSSSGDLFYFCVVCFVVLGLVSSVPSHEVGWENVFEMTYSVSSGT